MERLYRSVFVVVAVAAAFAIPTPPAAGRTAAAAPSWHSIAKAPIPGRLGASVVWTGHRMIVWGGFSGTYGKEARGDGAIYNPVTDTWHEIRSALADMIGGGRAAAWTGKRAIFWAGNPLEGPVGGAVYDPRTDRWRKLPRGPLSPREGYVSAWTGTELVVIGGSSGDGLAQPIAAAVDPRTGTWRRLPGLNHMDGLLPSGAVWSGDRLFVAGAAYDCASSPCTSSPIFLAYDMVTDVAVPIDLSDAPSPSITPIAWTGTEVLATGQDQASVVLYDPSTRGGPVPPRRARWTRAGTSRAHGSTGDTSPPADATRCRSTTSLRTRGRRSRPEAPRSTTVREARSCGPARI